MNPFTVPLFPLNLFAPVVNHQNIQAIPPPVLPLIPTFPPPLPLPIRSVPVPVVPVAPVIIPNETIKPPKRLANPLWIPPNQTSNVPYPLSLPAQPQSKKSPNPLWIPPPPAPEQPAAPTLNAQYVPPQQLKQLAPSVPAEILDNLQKQQLPTQPKPTSPSQPQTVTEQLMQFFAKNQPKKASQTVMTVEQLEKQLKEQAKLSQPKENKGATALVLQQIRHIQPKKESQNEAPKEAGPGDSESEEDDGEPVVTSKKSEQNRLRRHRRRERKLQQKQQQQDPKSEEPSKPEVVVAGGAGERATSPTMSKIVPKQKGKDTEAATSKQNSSSSGRQKPRADISGNASASNSKNSQEHNWGKDNHPPAKPKYVLKKTESELTSYRDVKKKWVPKQDSSAAKSPPQSTSQ